MVVLFNPSDDESFRLEAIYPYLNGITIQILKMKKIYSLLFLLLPQLVLSAPLIYYVDFTPQTTNAVKVWANTAELGAFVLEKPRTLPMSKAAPAPLVTCINTDKRSIVAYGEQHSCQRIQWTLPIQPVAELKNDVSIQQNLYSANGWQVLFEWNAIPRIQGQPSIEICAQSTERSAQSCQSLPETHQPPLIFPWGKASYRHQQQGVSLQIFFDGKTSFFNNRHWQQLTHQFTYLGELFSQPTSEQTLDLILIGMDKQAGSVGGAAGKRALIANYVSENGTVLVDELPRLHWIIGHEIFHIVSTRDYPLWVSESLAQYYGYKSLLQIGIESQTPIEILQAEQHKLPHIELGLYSAQKRFSDSGDMRYYPLFYIKGAAFWQAVDTLLAEHNSSLDSFLPILTENAQSDTLSQRFIDELDDTIGRESREKLFQRYLDDRRQVEMP